MLFTVISVILRTIQITKRGANIPITPRGIKDDTPPPKYDGGLGGGQRIRLLWFWWICMPKSQSSPDHRRKTHPDLTNTVWVRWGREVNMTLWWDALGRLNVMLFLHLKVGQKPMLNAYSFTVHKWQGRLSSQEKPGKLQHVNHVSKSSFHLQLMIGQH